ncbi:hypothetical protein D3C72_853820 [compost metagenome]
MRGHDGVEFVVSNERTENGHIVGADFRLRPRIARRLFVGIRRHSAVPREVFPGGFHTGVVHSVDKTCCHRQGDLRIFMVRTLANRRADVPDIQHRRKADINIHGDHFARHQPACILRQLAALLRSQQCSKRLRRRQTGKALAKTLNASAFLIDRHHQMVTGRRTDLTHQLAQLRGIVIVAGKQNEPTHQRMRQNIALFRIQFIPFDIQHYWTHTNLSYPLVCN